MAMAMAASSSSLQLLRRPTTNSLQIRGLNTALPIGRLGSKRNLKLLVVRATYNDQSDEADSCRLEEVEVRLGLKRKSHRDGKGILVAPPPPTPKPKLPVEAWDEMSDPEKAWELYIGEKGALFWLNKLAYASIFLIIGGWIVFQFIGPALGWYEVDSGLLPFSQVLVGTAGRLEYLQHLLQELQNEEDVKMSLMLELVRSKGSY